jgi:hypothetical protein
MRIMQVSAHALAQNQFRGTLSQSVSQSRALISVSRRKLLSVCHAKVFRVYLWPEQARLQRAQTTSSVPE